MTTAALAPARWEPPSAVRARGTLAVIAGAGEGVRVYERFGRRLAVDGYTVGVFETSDAAGAAAWLAEAETAPRVLVGADAGAAAALALAVAAADAAAATDATVDGVVVAGLASPGTPAAPADQRTACPVHLGVLAESDAAATRAVDPSAAADLPGPDALAGLAVPVLAIHGAADAVTAPAAARRTLSPIPTLELVETVDGLHDALNDVSHRSVAATIVLWLERLRGAGVQHPIVRPASPAQTLQEGATR
ncbi:hypothetical protein [Microbacterium telephonicum]|uniref:Alpha-beta hydrolase superfamily lysophospholipase n=1 Tax=Microbacterium telephonicum TaxID=1714841 RepID=A0A498CAF7_9MICO|nr:hypothetical protein [Microbacterium telephonicum]RLK52685.1 hypothetical protein C7474_0638 [Microbacterium telephonicum]